MQRLLMHHANKDCRFLAGSACCRLGAVGVCLYPIIYFVVLVKVDYSHVSSSFSFG